MEKNLALVDAVQAIATKNKCSVRKSQTVYSKVRQFFKIRPFILKSDLDVKN